MGVSRARVGLALVCSVALHKLAIADLVVVEDSWSEDPDGVADVGGPALGLACATGDRLCTHQAPLQRDRPNARAQTYLQSRSGAAGRDAVYSAGTAARSYPPQAFATPAAQNSMQMGIHVSSTTHNPHNAQAHARAQAHKPHAFRRVRARTQTHTRTRSDVRTHTRARARAHLPRRCASWRITHLHCHRATRASALSRRFPWPCVCARARARACVRSCVCVQLFVMYLTLFHCCE
jgi:hypothetical protein